MITYLIWHFWRLFWCCCGALTMASPTTATLHTKQNAVWKTSVSRLDNAKNGLSIFLAFSALFLENIGILASKQPLLENNPDLQSDHNTVSWEKTKKKLRKNWEKTERKLVSCETHCIEGLLWLLLIIQAGVPCFVVHVEVIRKDGVLRPLEEFVRLEHAGPLAGPVRVPS